jgi:hypothetical protein
VLNIKSGVRAGIVAAITVGGLTLPATAATATGEQVNALPDEFVGTFMFYPACAAEGQNRVKADPKDTVTGYHCDPVVGGIFGNRLWLDHTPKN